MVYPTKQTPPRRASVFDSPAKLAGMLFFSQARDGREMVTVRLSGYAEPFYGFRTVDKILPSGKKSFRATTFHLVRFSDEAATEESTQFCGALWERFSATREKQKLTNPDLGPDKYRVRIDGDLQNYMAYEAPTYIIYTDDFVVSGRIWERTSKAGKQYLQIRENQRDGDMLSIFPSASATVPILNLSAENPENKKKGDAVFDDKCELQSLTLNNKDYQVKKTADAMLVFPAKKRKPKKKDLEVLKEQQPKVTPVASLRPARRL